MRVLPASPRWSVGGRRKTAIACSWEHRDAPALLLEDVRLVLVASKHASNLGAVARVAANFETGSLWVVAPRCTLVDGEAQKIALNAGGVLAGATEVATLQEALASCEGSIGFTRRSGSVRQVHSSLRRFHEAHPAYLLSSGVAASRGSLEAEAAATKPSARLALVFGREESGLQDAEVALCSHCCAIPTGRPQPSMNLSHAVAVVLAQLFELRLDAAASRGPTRSAVEGDGQLAEQQTRPALRPAAAAEVDHLVERFSRLAAAGGLE